MTLLATAEALAQRIPQVDRLKKDDQTAKQIRAKTKELQEQRAEYCRHRALGAVLDPRVRPDSQRVQKVVGLLESFQSQFENPTGNADGWVSLKRSLSSCIKDVQDSVGQGIKDALKPLTKAHKDLESKRGVARALSLESHYAVLANELAALKARDWNAMTSEELASALSRAKKFLAGWEKLGLGDLPPAVERFLAQVHATGASLEEFEAEDVRQWLTNKKLIQKIRIIFRE
jgi:hypothetical protein